MQRGNPMELDFEGLETRQWNRPTDRAQIVCLVIMFTPGVMVIKMSKWLICILQMTEKVSHSLGKIFQHSWKILFSFFRKCYGFLVSKLPLARYQPVKIRGLFIFFADSAGFLYFFPQYLSNGNSKTRHHFLKELNTIFQVHLTTLHKL